MGRGHAWFLAFKIVNVIAARPPLGGSLDHSTGWSPQQMVRPGYGSVSTRQGLTLHTWEPSGFLDGCLGNIEFVPKGRPWQ